MRKVILFCLVIILLGMMFILFLVCNGILSSLYDELEIVKDFGFIMIDYVNYSGMVWVDVI